VSSTEDAGRRIGVHYEGDLRSALVAAAVAALEQAGAEELSLRALARSAGVSHAAPAHHFGDKTGLLTAVATEGFGLFAQHLAQSLAFAPEEPLKQLAQLGCAYAEFAELHPGHFAVMFRPGLTDTGDAAYVAASDAAFQALERHVALCQGAGWRTAADTRTLASAAWALAHGITVLRSQGALARHFPDRSLDGVAALASTLIGPALD
jgi:AcrR family transcriptional regulator